MNAGANAGGNTGNTNFNTGVEDLTEQPADWSGELVPPDDGFGTPGDGTFNTPPLVEAADSGPFFHNNSVATTEGAVAFYNGDAFNNSPSGAGINGINLNAAQVAAVAAFLRVINALENIRQSIELLEASVEEDVKEEKTKEQLGDVVHEIDDSIMVLSAAGLHPTAVSHLETARQFAEEAANDPKSELVRQAINELEQARDQIVE